MTIPQQALTPSVVKMRRTALVVCLVSCFVNPFIGTSLNIALPSMATELSLDARTVPWVLTIFTLASSICMLPMGRIADIYGRKRLFATGWALFSVTSLIVTLSSSGPMLLTLRVFQGASGSMFLGAAVGILSSVYPREERGRALGLSVAAQYGGSSLGPVLGGILTQNYGWRSIYWTMVPLACLMSLMISKGIGMEWADARGEKVDTVGSLIYGGSLALLMYGVSLLPNLTGLVPMVVGIASLGLFGWWELRVEAPVLNIRLLKGNLSFAFANVAALISFSASASVAFLLSMYLQNVKGLTPRVAGLIMIAQPAVQSVLSAPAGHWADRTGIHRKVASFGMAVTALSLFLFSRMTVETSLWVVVRNLMILGVGIAFFAPPNMSIVMNSVDRKYYGVASALVTTARQVGSMFSTGISAVIFATFLGGVTICPAIASQLLVAIRAAFTVTCSVCTAGVLVSLVAGTGVTEHNESASQ